MTREEAINEIRSWDFLNGKEIEAVQTLIPELRESDDERIRKEIIYFFETIPVSELKRIPRPISEWFAWLEKQNEYHIPWYDYQKSKEAGYTIVPNEEYEQLIKQKEQKPVDYEHEMWKNCETNFEGGKKEVIEHPEKYGLQKEQNSIEDVIKSITKNKEAAIKFLKSAGIMDDNGELAEMYRSEQKSADYNYDNRIQYDSIKSGVEAFASTYSFNIESKLFSQLTKEQQQLWREEIEQAVVAGGENGIELARDNRYKENRMVEWSEEDETIIEGACNALEVYGHTKLANKLKSLRPQPHWKPSEEQMNHLSAAVIEAQRRHNESVNGFPRYRVLKELEEQLRKQM